MWRWKVMSPTSITTSLGNPVVQNLKTTDAQIRSDITEQQQITNQVKDTESNCFTEQQITMLGLWSWPPPAAAAAPVPPHEPSPARSSSSPASSNPFKSSNGEAFLGRMSGLCSWESGKGRSSLASRNNGVLPIPVGGSKGFPSGEDEDKMAFLVF